MKHTILVFILILMPVTAFAISKCQVCVEAKWNSVEKSSLQKEKIFGDKLMLVGSITFRKQCKDCIKLDRLALEWHGPQITTLCGSLYRRLPEKTFVPIQENLICDARWNKGLQTLVLEFENQQTLNSVSIFYLVLAIPHGLEETLKQGHFTLLDSNLPDQISLIDKKLNLALACQSH